MKLSALLEQSVEGDIEIQGLCLDSRFVHPGEVFVALSGERAQGQDFVLGARERGAVAILTDQPLDMALDCPVVVVPNLRMQLSALAARFYGYPSRSLHVVGVTGTNGKSSVCDLLQQAWRALGLSGAAIGTLGVYGQTQWRRPGMTTADPIQVQAELAMLRDAGVTHVAMEVSSHGLVQGRVEAVEFQCGVFTNLSRDHLDYHGTLDAYAQAKQRLFTELSCAHRVLNADTPAAVAVADPQASLYGSQGTISISDAQADSAGWRFTLNVQDQTRACRTHLLGVFNLDNLCAVVAVLLNQGVALDAIANLIPQLSAVPGRMEWVSHQPAVLVDYAHTPDGLSAALMAARQHCQGQLWLVFGAGGDRDVGKRPMMGQVAGDLADCIIVTSDNPRSEDPTRIIEQIQAGIGGPSQAVEDRVAAIHQALQSMSPEDTLVIAGKGHETQQILANTVVHHDDREVAKAWLEGQTC